MQRTTSLACAECCAPSTSGTSSACQYVRNTMAFIVRSLLTGDALCIPASAVVAA